MVKYEDLKNDINLFRKLCEDFNVETVSNLEDIYTKPSSKTHPKSDIRSGETKESQQLFSKVEWEQINTILEAFKQDFYPIKPYTNL